MVTRNPRLRVARFSQHHVDNMTMPHSVLEQVCDIACACVHWYVRWGVYIQWYARGVCGTYRAQRRPHHVVQFRMDYPNDPPQQIRKHLGNMGVQGVM